MRRKFLTLARQAATDARACTQTYITEQLEDADAARGGKDKQEMIASKHLPIITCILVCILLVASGSIVYAAYATDTTRTPAYQKRMFGDEVVTLDIQTSAADWQRFLDNAQSKEWVAVDLVINGERFSTVGMRTKGNASLWHDRGENNNDRYSLQFKMNKFVKGQTYYGLDTFCVNNMIGDATYMKDYLAYDLMDFIGVVAPLTNYANVSVNGEAYAFGVALERYDKAFLDRVYNTSAGQLYNVRIQREQPGAAGNAGNAGRNAASPGGGQWGAAPGADSFGRNGGGSLMYRGDDFDNYYAIFDYAVFNTNDDNDKGRIITAIQHLNAGSDLEKYFDVDGILRYFAAEAVLVNSDGYTSSMQQNYYIYEREGKLSILPWDYGCTFGSFRMTSASSVVNFPIDSPVYGVGMSERPLLFRLLEVEEYRSRYHGYIRQIIDGYFDSGIYAETIRSLDAKISPYVKQDVSPYYSHARYERSLTHLLAFGRLRSQSVRGQLDGTIPSTLLGQWDDSTALVDASDFNLNALGSVIDDARARRDWWD